MPLYAQILHDDAPPLSRLTPDVPVDVLSIIAKCMEKVRDHRYASATALADEIARYRAGGNVQAQEAGERAGRVARRLGRRARVIALVLLVAGSLVAVGLVARSVLAARERAAQEQVENDESD